MGNSSSSSGRGQHDETVDFGHLSPQGVYSGTRDYNQAIVSQLIFARKLAPFYRPLEEYDEKWDDAQILAARKELLDPDGNPSESSTATTTTTTTLAAAATRTEQAAAAAYPNCGTKAGHSKRSSVLKEPSKPEAAVYRGAVECPICFLYYPPNINHSRCCDQAICTECFVQIKRAEPTTTHLVSEPAACPYCVQDNFGVVYRPPVWRAGIGSETLSSFWSDSSKAPQPSAETHPTHKRRQKSFGADSPEVVTSDQIRPDWEAKLAAVRAAVTRRANRRIIMRQVGDRLIPVGITSGRVHPISPEEAQNENNEGGGSRRSRRRQQQQQQQQQQQEFNQFLGSMGLGGQDLEELMVMEAMRLSLLDHEEHLRREADNRNAKEGTSSRTAAAVPESSSSLAVPMDGPSNSSHHATIFNDLTPSSSAPISSVASASRSPSPRPSSHEISHPQERATQSSSAIPTIQQPASFPSLSPIATMQGRNDTGMVRRHHLSSPPPFTPLSAGIGTTATANATLGSGDPTAVGVWQPPNDSSPRADGGPSSVDIGTAGQPPTMTVAPDTAEVVDLTSASSDPLSSMSKENSVSSSTVPAEEVSGSMMGDLNSLTLMPSSSSSSSPASTSGPMKVTALPSMNQLNV